MDEAKNGKFVVTDIPHEKYPFLHRIRALRNIGHDVKKGDLGGFVEGEYNLSFEEGDEAWIYDDAIAAGSSVIDQGSQLRDRAIVCDTAYVSQGSVLSGNARAEDQVYIRGADMKENARASGDAMVINSSDTHMRPELAGNCVIFGKVTGGVSIRGKVVVFYPEEVVNASLDRFIVSDEGRTVVRDPSRDELSPHPPKKEDPQPVKPRTKQRGRSR